jgi:PEP-CTERM motif-containing protein
MKKIVGISLTLIGIFSAGAAETLAAPLVVEQGGFFSSIFLGSGQNNGDFSGDNFAVTIFATGTGVFGGLFTTGIWDVVFERGSNFLGGTIQVGDDSCQTHPYPPDPAGPACSGNLRFISQPLPLVPNIVHEAPFTMTGQLVLGRLGLPDLIVEIEGSGIVSGIVQSAGSFQPPPLPPITGTAYRADYRFAVPEPSTVVLVLSGLVAVGWSRRRGKHLPLYPDAEPGRVA